MSPKQNYLPTEKKLIGKIHGILFESNNKINRLVKAKFDCCQEFWPRLAFRN